jgi:hypothetical protein
MCGPTALPEPDHQPLACESGQSTAHRDLLLRLGQAQGPVMGATIDARGQFDGVKPPGGLAPRC